MNKDTKQRNIIITIILWLAILVNLAMTVGAIVLMYDASVMEEALGFGLCSMFTFANVLGAILLMRWNKNGLSLMAISGILLSIVYGYVLNYWIIETIPFIGVVAFIWLILHIRKGGKSAWSQLKSGWDSKHCRHIYQIFAVTELILFILTLVAFGGNKGKMRNPEPAPVLQDTIVIAKLNPVENISRDSIPVADSIKVESPDVDQTNTKSETEGVDKAKQNESKTNPEKSPNTYSLDDAARYLDTHNVWNVSEMNKYPDLRHLDEYLRKSLHSCHDMLPSNLASKSKRLREISRLLREVEHLSISNDKKRIMSRLRSKSYRGISSDNIEPNLIRNSIIETIDEARSYDRRKKSTGDEPNNSKPSDEKQVKKRSIGGASPAGKDDADPKEVRKKRIQKDIDDYKKIVSEEAKNAEPTFNLR